MSNDAQQLRLGHDADPWWDDTSAKLASTTTATNTTAKKQPRSVNRSKKKRPLLVRMLLFPLVALAAFVRRSTYAQALLRRLIILVIISVIVGGAVGVILLNNIVIKRTSELGKLDTERRDLRRENAALGAQVADKSSQPQVVKRASTELGMIRAAKAPTYTYLDPSSVGLTAQQRAIRAARNAKLEAASAAQVKRTVKKDKQ